MDRTIEIRKQRFYYQKWWFRFGCVLLALSVVLVGYRVHVNRIRAEFTATLKERTRIAREMHDTVLQGCTGISVLLEAASDVILSADHMTSSSSEIEKTAKAARL